MTYRVEWGDLGVDEGFVESGGGFTLSHKWLFQGNYIIRAKLIDEHGAEGDWATFEVTMPKNKVIQRPIMQFLQNHPNLFPLLQRLTFLRLGLQ
jgi:hypothetical protein